MENAIRKKKILAIDDEKGFTDLIKDILEQTGQYEVLAENIGTRAICIIKSYKPDLILLDIMMPDITGFDIARLLIRDEECKPVPIVFLSAFLEEDDDILIDEGHALLTKPIQVEKLLTCIAEHLKDN